MEQGTSADGAATAPAQVKLCECGCGQPTRIARTTITRAGVVAGQPMRFIVGHNGRGVPRVRLPEITQMVKVCECGCGNPVPVARQTSRVSGHVKGQPVRFIRGHSGVALVARLAAEARLAGPAPEPRLCECGCGEPAPVATKNRPEIGHAKGWPIRFIKGHRSRTAIRPLRLGPGQVAQFVRLCECGCGHPTPVAAQNYAPYSAVKGQPLKFILGHRPSVTKGPRRKLFVDIGQRFGASVVVDPETRHVTRSGISHRAARLFCDCGAEFVRTIAHVLRSPDTQSCGNCAGADDFTGRRFERLTAVQWIPSGTTARGDGRWLCRCDCGNEVTHLRAELTGGRAKSCGCRRSGPRNGPAFRSSLNRYQANARSRDLPWGLTNDDFLRLTSLDCHYCGAAPATVAGTFVYNGLDRVDNSLGYFLSPAPGNVAPCCGMCNHAKGTMSYDEFLAWIARVASFHFFRPDMTPVGLLKTSAARDAG